MVAFLKSITKAILYQPLYNALIFLVWLVPGDNVGLAIILLTLLVRIALYPMNAGMIRSQRSLQSLQPEIDRIRSEYKQDQAAQSKALMELYAERKINPFGSCFGLIVQLPILWILYKVFTVGLDTSRFALLYAFTPRPESLMTTFVGIDLHNPSLMLGVVAGLAQFVQSRQLTATQPKRTKDPAKPVDPQALISQQMLYLFPVMTVIISLQLPSALALYWITTTLAMVAQQWYMHRQHTDEPIRDVTKVTVRTSKK